MTKKCENCQKEYVPVSDVDTIFTVCSNFCRSQMYHKKNARDQIDQDNYQHMTVKKIIKLGYQVTVTKK